MVFRPGTIRVFPMPGGMDLVYEKPPYGVYANFGPDRNRNT